MKAVKSLLALLGFEPRIRAVPQRYAGVRFASTLEADWAATFDALDITWSYEPMAVRLSDGQVYRCDFWLPAQRIWCEVKGPHDLRIDKPRRLWTDVGRDEDDWRATLVVICREPIHGDATAERADGLPMTIGQCYRCGHHTFVDVTGPWQCRICGTWDERLAIDRMPFYPLERTYDRRTA